MNTAKWAVMLLLGTMLSIGIHPAPGLASPILGSAQNFAVLGATTVTNTGLTTITGDLGLYGGTSITGFPPGVVIGTTHTMDAVAMEAQSDALSAYSYLAAMTGASDLTGQDLGGLTLTSGVYKFSSSALLTGTLTLDGGGPFVFQIGSTLTTAADSKVLYNGSDDGLFWQIGSSATLGADTTFEGNILALASITLGNNATILDGRALALTGAVTLDANTINLGAGTSPVPLPGALLLLGSGLGALFGFRKKLRLRSFS